ncbi:MAG: hypothetical protein GY830_08100, partial [Bacteroidetes bacterium]|nr:hypothetical protein [Bacteroidota bacterium]
KLFVKCGSTVIKGLDYVMKNPKATVKEVNEFLKSSKEIVQALGGADTVKLAQEMINASSQKTGKALGNEIKNYPKNFIKEFENADYKRRLEMGGEVFGSALMATEVITNVAKSGSKFIKNRKLGDIKKIGPPGDPGAKCVTKLPENWTSKVTKKNNGTIYKNPKKPDYDHIRFMNENPDIRALPGQDKPYFVRIIDGNKVLTRNKKWVLKKSADPFEYHIPQEMFDQLLPFMKLD